MPKVHAVQLGRPDGPLGIVDRETPQPAPLEVRVKVQACGPCHSDSLAKEGHFLGITRPQEVIEADKHAAGVRGNR
jgi:D-arabinose 1-dehydrogenase-like Zn-dependent alcohol dehydrogenase